MRFSVCLTARYTCPAEDRPVIMEMTDHAVDVAKLASRPSSSRITTSSGTLRPRVTR
jgi:hypothetical protein